MFNLAQSRFNYFVWAIIAWTVACVMIREEPFLFEPRFIVRFSATNIYCKEKNFQNKQQQWQYILHSGNVSYRTPPNRHNSRL